jgi:hypothetical protein
MRNIYLLSFCILTLSLCTRAQTIQRSSLNSFGATVASPGVVLTQSAGQDAAITCLRNSELGLHQGFQQAVLYKPADASSYSLTAMPNPHSGLFRIVHTIPDDEVLSVNVIDASGRQVPFSLIPGERELQIRLSGNPVPGFYPVIIRSPKHVWVVKTICIP